MTEDFWTITNPAGGAAVSLASLRLSVPSVDFQVMGISTARMIANRDFDSEDAWWAFDALVTIYRDGAPFFTGRVQECPDFASGETEVRTLVLADAWQDLEEITYREEWGIGEGAFLYPRCVLGLNDAGTQITTGEQIEAVVDFAIAQGSAMARGTVDAGFQLWPSEVRNASCEGIIIGELRFHPDWVAWLDHSTSPPTFHARAKSALETVTIDIADEKVESHNYAEVKRTVPRGVSIIYESATSVDGDVYRTGYLDEAGVTTGRRVMRAMLDLEGLDVQFQKSRIQTRTLPTSAATMPAFLKAKFPELADIPDINLQFSNFSSALVAEPAHAPPINTKALRITPSLVADVPRELVSGSIEDWMRVAVNRVTVQYDLKVSEIGLTAPQKKIAANFSGKGKTISVVGTSATTKIYKGISSFTEGEGRPTGLAAAIFAAATAQQWEGQVTTVHAEIPAGRWHGKKLTLTNGATTLLSGAVIHSANMDVESGRITVNFGPMPNLSAGDFLELQRIFNGRKVKWVSPQERTANTLGATDHGGSQGDNVGGYDIPDTVTAPGGSEPLLHQWQPTQAAGTTIDMKGGVLTSQAGFALIEVADVAGLEATESGHVILTVTRDSSTRAVSGTPVMSFAAGTLPESDYNAEIIPLVKVTVEGEEEEAAISELLPLKFEELHIFESLVKVNGESKLASLLMSGQIIYDLPTA